LRYKTKIKKIAAVGVLRLPDIKTALHTIDGGKFVTVLAEVETKKWPWSKPVIDCAIFSINTRWDKWRHAYTLDRVKRSVAKSLTACLASYMEGHEDGKNA
jgi:hypothetical protein